MITGIVKYDTMLWCDKLFVCGYTV